MSLKKQNTMVSKVWVVECFNAGCRALSETRFDELAQALLGNDPAGKTSASEHDWVHPFYLDQQADTMTPIARARRRGLSAVG